MIHMSPTKTSKTVRAVVLLATLAALSGCEFATEDEVRKVGRNAHFDYGSNQSSACGVLRVDQFDDDQGGPPDGAVREHWTTYVRSAAFDTMEDNDLRGFLDGSFKEGWNQVSQAHLRLGRRARNPAYGEYELFRNLQRWDGIELPPGSRVTDARVELSLESGPPYPVDVAIYAVKRDWNPGAGGVHHDNNSPPAGGEVWWREARHGEEAWTIAGAGFASDTHPDADTGAMPLALARFDPASTTLAFQSTQLTSYVQARVQQRLPVLFLIKLTDPYEDSVGSVLEIWSANVGIDGSRRRPTLALRWSRTGAAQSLDQPVTLEHGRFIEFALPGPGNGGWLSASWIPAADAGGVCGQEPFLEVRVGDDLWRPLNFPARLPAGERRLRVTAGDRPVPLGGRIRMSLRDTWIPVGAAEDHEVAWTVHRPDQVSDTVSGHYLGDYTWQLDILADIPGHWTVQWQHALSGEPVQSERIPVDVVAYDLAAVATALERLAEAVDGSGARPRSFEMLPFEIAFVKLERAAVNLGASTSGAAESEHIASKIREIRAKLSGQDVPARFEPASIRSREAEIPE